jgi:hypothetical protein
MEAGITIGLISMLGVVAIYFWVVRRAHQEVAQKE